jgi:hypothetical protein
VNPTNPTTTRPDDDVDATLYDTPTTAPARRAPEADRDTQLSPLGTVLFFVIPLTFALVLGYLIAQVWP